MQTSLSHLIGTSAALIIMTALVAAAFQVGTSHSIDITRHQLQEVTDYVAHNVHQLIQAAVNFSSSYSVIRKELSIPASLGDRGYTITLSNVTGSLTVSGWVDTQPFIKAQSILPINGTGIAILINDNDGEQIGEVTVRSVLHSSSVALLLAWVQTSDDCIVIGLGTMSG